LLRIDSWAREETRGWRP